MRIFQSYSYCFFFFCFSNIFLFAQKNELNANAYSYKELKVLVEKYEKQLKILNMKANSGIYNVATVNCK